MFLVVRYLGNHEFPDHEKNDLDLDFLLLMSCAFIHEFPFFKIKQQAGNCFTRYLQRREKQFPDKQFLYLLRNHKERGAWILKLLQYRTSHMALKKSNLGIHDVSKHLNREIDSQLDQIIFDLGIHDVDKNVIGFSLPIITFFCFCRIPQLHLDKTTHKYIIIGSTNSCGLGTSAASAIIRKHRKYQYEIHQTIFDHLSDLSCWRDLEIHITAADSSQHLWNGHLVRRSYERTDQAGCSSRNWKISYRNHATHVHTGGSRADGQLGKSASDFTARCDHHDRDQHHCHGIHRTAVSMGHPTWKKAGGGKDGTKERGVS